MLPMQVGEDRGGREEEGGCGWVRLADRPAGILWPMPLEIIR